MANHPFYLSMLAPVPYGWQLHSRTRALADEFAARGLRVRFVAPPTPRAMLRHWLAPWRDRSAGNIDLIWSLPVPPLHWQQRLGLVNAIAARQAARVSATTPAAHVHVLIAATPLWTPVVARTPCDLLVYDCLDDPLVHARPSSGDIYARWHEELCRRADVVVAVSAALADRLRSQTDRPVVVCGNGVHAQAFVAPSAPEPTQPGTTPARSGTAAQPAAPDLEPTLREWFAWRQAHPDHPVAGFVGSIDRWVDVELLANLARARPQMHVVVAGPERHRGLAAPLAGLPNLHRIGLVPYAAVPALIATFNVGLIPFTPGPIAAAADPLKVYEYAAAGKPVVCSVTLRLDDPDAPLITAESPEAFIRATSTAAAPDNNASAAQHHRIAFARRHTWSARAGEFLAIINDALARRRPTASAAHHCPATRR